MVKLLSVVVAAALLVSCSSTTKVPLSSRGHIATITLNNLTSHQAELLALQDSVLITASDSIRIFREQDIQSVNLNLDHDRGPWITALMLTQVAPSIVGLVRGEERYFDHATVGLVGLGLSALTTVWFISSEPQGVFVWPLSARQSADLSLSMRYPYGLTPERIEQLRNALHPRR